MSKTIYDEALDGYSHVKAIVQNKKSHLTWEQEIHHLANITRALQQAQKQEQLLKLYKELIAVKDKMLSCCEFPYDDEYIDLEEEAKDLENKIKELENEKS